MAALQWPGSQFNEEGSDLLEPVQILLREVNVLEKDGEVATLWATPPSVQAITAGSTMVSKAWTSLLGAAGGGGALVAALNSVSDDWKNDPRASPFIFASAITLGAVAIAIALIVRGDVAGRAAASAAQYEARARIAVAAIETIGSGRPGRACANAPSNTSTMRCDVSTLPAATAAGRSALTSELAGAWTWTGAKQPAFIGTSSSIRLRTT